jgi:hypothetical protein
MKTSFKELQSPHFEGEREFLSPADELSKTIAQAIGENPFSHEFEQSGGRVYLPVERGKSKKWTWCPSIFRRGGNHG